MRSEGPNTGTGQRPTGALTVSVAIVRLCALIALLALAAAGAGLFWSDGDGPRSFTTLHGETVALYGRGLYRDDTVFKAGGFQGTDAVTLGIGIPLLVVCTLLYRRGSLRGGLLLTGTLGYFLYVYASLALGAAYNRLFLVYIVLFSAGLFALVLAFTSIDLRTFPAHVSPTVPRRGPALFMVAGGLVTLVVWLGPLLGALLQGEPPELLDSYTTSVTDVLDLGVITPAAILAGALILRRALVGYLMAFSLLVLEVMLAPMIAAQTVAQIAAGVTFTPAEIVGPMAGFVTLGLIAIWVTAALLRTITDAAAQ
jgi:hypothetical protein